VFKNKLPQFTTSIWIPYNNGKIQMFVDIWVAGKQCPNTYSWYLIKLARDGVMNA